MVSLEFMGKNETNIICFQYYCTLRNNICIDHVSNLYSKIRVKKEVATVAGIPQDKPNSSIENNRNGASITPINGSIISTTLKPSNGTNINCQVATHTNGQKQVK